jgi:hypothetical protein
MWCRRDGSGHWGYINIDPGQALNLEEDTNVRRKRDIED